MMAKFCLSVKNELFDDAKGMVMSKSIGNALRIAGVQAALRSSVEATFLNPDEDFDVTTVVINGDDMTRALALVGYSVQCHFTILDATQRKGTKRSLALEMPEAENIDSEFLQLHRHKIQKLFSSATNGEILMSKITKDKVYPQIGTKTGSEEARKFISALQLHGIGKFDDNDRKFVLFNRENISAPEKIELFKKLGIW